MWILITQVCNTFIARSLQKGLLIFILVTYNMKLLLLDRVIDL